MDQIGLLSNQVWYNFKTFATPVAAEQSRKLEKPSDAFYWWSITSSGSTLVATTHKFSSCAYQLPSLSASLPISKDFSPLPKIHASRRSVNSAAFPWGCCTDSYCRENEWIFFIDRFSSNSIGHRVWVINISFIITSISDAQYTKRSVLLFNVLSYERQFASLTISRGCSPPLNNNKSGNLSGMRCVTWDQKFRLGESARAMCNIIFHLYVATLSIAFTNNVTTLFVSSDT